jgi:hypothetical protein
MGNENEKNEQNPGHQQNNPRNRSALTGRIRRREENIYNPQDPTVKKPGPTPLWLIVRTVKGRRRLKKRMHRNRIMDSGDKPRQTAVAFRWCPVPPRAGTQAVGRDGRRWSCYTFFLFHLPG